MKSVLVTSYYTQPKELQSLISSCSALCQTQPVNQVFFYLEAVRYSNKKDADVYSHWSDLKTKYSLPFIVCRTAADRRDIDTSISNVFEFAGLSEFYARLHQCDEIVQL